MRKMCERKSHLIKMNPENVLRMSSKRIVNSWKESLLVINLGRIDS